jgi:hypothetical protein
VFRTRNKLFDHIRATRHAAVKDEVAAGAAAAAAAAADSDSDRPRGGRGRRAGKGARK